MQPSPNRFLQRQRRPSLRLTFAPLAWLKLQYFCHAGSTEVGGFAITAADDLLYVEDFITVKQQATSVRVRFRDEAVADFFDRCVDAGLAPQRFGRIWCHTHPSTSVTPSSTDEETFARGFGSCDWSAPISAGWKNLTRKRLDSRDIAAIPLARCEVISLPRRDRFCMAACHQRSRAPACSGAAHRPSTAGFPVWANGGRT